MAKEDNKVVKILFRFYSNVLDEWTVETMWAEVVDQEKGLYKIANIPFYASIASDDIVFAEYDDDEERLTYRETVEFSGNSTVQVVIMDKNTVANDIRDIFNDMGCPSEKASEGYFVLEIPVNVDYRSVKQKLSELENNNVIGYAEPVLADGHQY
ncbi:DUF4265 domain-containing protein [Hufsiella ginkgonis]|uniref:DUF4265 domain-containing protein n=1 Tax=Hufsiella ginkgonis TaxID=2695274 RepID=A0A7K1XTJ6_9SPHI|nr:DUF4265 domain-containing protein [Hufsiella ginkgonis]MXV14325.1 DUF4265 domain-containing protein [Hufsiella ginkgonis]